jgi:8-oxo-dGTP diphosphatase
VDEHKPTGHFKGMHVAVGVVRDVRDRVLIAQRPEGVHLAGFWEFPGGKVEAGESVEQALRRELREELGIEAGRLSPLIQVSHDYRDRPVFLDVWTVHSFVGEPRGLQGQPVRWVDSRELPHIAFPAANHPIATAARLPEYYGIADIDSDDPARIEWILDRWAAQGVRLAQWRLRAPIAGERVRDHLIRAIGSCRDRGIELLLNVQPELAMALGAGGVHLKSRHLMAFKERPLPHSHWVAASCHDLSELRQAQRIGVDFAVLSPVAPTLSHPDAEALGWCRFARWVRAVNLPVYALGGLGPADLSTARASGAQGVAAIRGLLSDPPQISAD